MTTKIQPIAIQQEQGKAKLDANWTCTVQQLNEVCISDLLQPIHDGDHARMKAILEEGQRYFSLNPKATYYIEDSGDYVISFIKRSDPDTLLTSLPPRFYLDITIAWPRSSGYLPHIPTEGTPLGGINLSEPVDIPTQEDNTVQKDDIDERLEGLLD